VWKVAPCSWTAAERLSRELDLPLVAATVLASRGFADTAAAQAFLECRNSVPSPFLFADMQAAVDAILEAAERGRRVVVHGDYDADGITATALMVLGLRPLGIEAEAYLPDRFSQGFGLSRGAVESIAAAGDALLITVDCGVNYPEEIALARGCRPSLSRPGVAGLSLGACRYWIVSLTRPVWRWTRLQGSPCPTLPPTWG
jgi:single-stranded-DNA-specific exonuclease